MSKAKRTEEYGARSVGTTIGESKSSFASQPKAVFAATKSDVDLSPVAAQETNIHMDEVLDQEEEEAKDKHNDGNQVDEHQCFDSQTEVVF